MVAGPFAEFAQSRACSAHGLIRPCHSFTLGAQRRVRVQVQQMGARVGQGVMLVLGRDIHQPLRQPLELRRRNQAAVDVGSRAPRTLEYAAHQQLPLIELRTPLDRVLEPHFREHLLEQWSVDVFEQRLDLRVGTTRAHQSARPLPAQSELEGGNDDGLSSSRLTGQHVKSRAERQLDIFDDC